MISSGLGQDLPALDAAALTRLHTHFQTLGAGGERWVADGIGRVAANPDGGVQACPFCGQDLAGSTLIEAYRAYFSAEYAALDQRVSAMISDVQRAHGAAVLAAFERSVRTAGERQRFWSSFTDVPPVELNTADISRDWQAAKDDVEAVLRAKKASPLSRMTLPEPLAARLHAFEQHRHTIDGLSASLLAVNAAIPTIRERAAAGNVAAIEADIRDLSAIRARFEVMPTPLLIQHSTGVPLVRRRGLGLQSGDESFAELQIVAHGVDGGDVFPRLCDRAVAIEASVRVQTDFRTGREAGGHLLCGALLDCCCGCVAGRTHGQYEDEPDEGRAFALLLGDGGRRGGMRETHEEWSIALMHLTEPPEGVPRP